MIHFNASSVLRFAIPLIAYRLTELVNDDGFVVRSQSPAFIFNGTVTKDKDAESEVKREGIRSFKAIKIMVLPTVELMINDEVVFNNEKYKITGFDTSHIHYGYLIYKANNLTVVVE